MKKAITIFALIILYICGKAQQGGTDCDTDEFVQTLQQFQQLNSVKRSVTINNPNGLVIPSGTKKTIRATDFISINGPFEILSGGCLALIMQECPNTD